MKQPREVKKALELSVTAGVPCTLKPDESKVILIEIESLRWMLTQVDDKVLRGLVENWAFDSGELERIRHNIAALLSGDIQVIEMPEEKG